MSSIKVSFITQDSLDPKSDDYIETNDKKYGFYKSELLRYWNNTTYGLIKNPFTNKLFTDDGDLDRFTEIYERNLSKANQKRELVVLSTDTLSQIYSRLVIPLSEDYDIKNGFTSTTDNMLEFTSYYSQMPRLEKEYLDELVVKWKKPLDSSRNCEETRTKFKDIYSWVSEGTLCHHQAAVYFWELLRKESPSLYGDGKDYPTPNKVSFTSRYWGGMLMPENQDTDHGGNPPDKKSNSTEESTGSPNGGRSLFAFKDQQNLEEQTSINQVSEEVGSSKH